MQANLDLVGHEHGHSHRQDRNLRRLGLTLGLAVTYMVAEFVGGLLTGSLALLADAGHMLSDSASLGLALFAIWIAGRPRTPERTFGYHRTEILAALANGATLVAIAALVTVEAWERFQNPRPVDGVPMLLIAAGGLLVNLAGVAILHGGKDESLNVRGAWLHVLADTLGSLQALVAGILIWQLDWNWADPLASVLISVLILWSAWALLRESVHVLMEGTPAHIDTGEVAAAIRSVEGVRDVHDLHVWTITSGFDALSVHARCEDDDRDAILTRVRRTLRERFAIDHSTIQLEGEEGCEEPPCE